MWENEQEAIVKIRLPRKHQALADVVSLTENGLMPKSVTRHPEELLLFQVDLSFSNQEIFIILLLRTKQMD